MRIDFLATEPHYRDHLHDLWLALPEGVGGNLHNDTVFKGDTPVVVASWKDALTARRKGRPVILMEHGAGQTYQGVNHPSYVGASEREGVMLYLAPSERCADEHRAVCPDIPVEVVGCPKLDAYINRFWPNAAHVAVAHHWTCGIAPETRSAWPHFHAAYGPVASALGDYGPTRLLIGHAHPRALDKLSGPMQRKHMRVVPDFAGVVANARVLVVDNSSVGAEWLALDRPVVWLNAPWYRKDVHHGGRFWDWAQAGHQVDEPEDLEAAIMDALDNDPYAEARRAIVPSIYANLGHATEAAVAAVLRHTS